MTRQQLISSVLATFVFFTLAGNVMASDIGTEAGNYEVNFNQPMSPEQQQAVTDHVYTPELLSAIGTEAGAWDVNYDDPEALEAARNHPYNSGHLQAVGTEAGNYDGFEQNPEPQSVCILC